MTRMRVTRKQVGRWKGVAQSKLGKILKRNPVTPNDRPITSFAGSLKTELGQAKAKCGFITHAHYGVQRERNKVLKNKFYTFKGKVIGYPKY